MITVRATEHYTTKSLWGPDPHGIGAYETGAGNGGTRGFALSVAVSTPSSSRRPVRAPVTTTSIVFINFRRLRRLISEVKLRPTANGRSDFEPNSSRRREGDRGMSRASSV